MCQKQFFIYFAFIFVLCALISYFYRTGTNKQATAILYKIECPEKRTIKHEIITGGVLEIKNTMKLGSQLAGIIKDIFVKENQFVKNGAVLAIIETSKDDKDIRLAQQNLKKAAEDFRYQEANFNRQKQLFLANQLSKNNFEKIKSDYEKSRAERNVQKVTLEKAKLEYTYTQIKAPDDGIVTAVNVSRGTAVVNDFQYVIFEIVHNINEMIAIIDIDESEIGYVKPGQRVKLTVNTFPDQAIYTTIKDVSYTPKSPLGKNGSEGVQFYKATIDIPNKDMRLRPGMMVNAKITVEKIKNTLSISGLTFQINPETLKYIAHKLHMDYNPLSSQQKKDFKKAHQGEKTRYVWTVDEKSFTQKIILIGTTDNNHWNIIDGINEHDKIVNDVQEPNEMDKLYKAWFKGAL
jgi:HlyD family secretion protein